VLRHGFKPSIGTGCQAGIESTPGAARVYAGDARRVRPCGLDRIGEGLSSRASAPFIDGPLRFRISTETPSAEGLKVRRNSAGDGSAAAASGRSMMNSVSLDFANTCIGS
jgi:hypothetical protein